MMYRIDGTGVKLEYKRREDQVPEPASAAADAPRVAPQPDHVPV